MNPKTRNLLQLTVADGEANYAMINDWMGDDVNPRKKLIEEQLHNYINDID